MLAALHADKSKQLAAALHDRMCQARTAFLAESAAQVALLAATVLAVGSGFYGLQTLTFCCAALNTLSGALARYATSARHKASSLAALAEKLAATASTLEIIPESPNSPSIGPEDLQV